MPILPCQICGRDFPARPYRIAKGTAKYCSQLCYYTAMGWDTSRFTKAVHTCPDDPKCLACYVASDPVKRYREKAILYMRRSYPKQRAKQMFQKRLRYETDPEYREKLLERGRRYIAANRDKINARARARRAPKHRNWSRRQVWEIAINLLAVRDGKACWICHMTWTLETVSIDHVIPVYAGGTHAADNIRLAHRTCNMRRQRVGLVAWNREKSIG